MPSLALVIEIVELVDEASQQQRAIDVDAEAARLLKGHPEAEVSKGQVVDLLRNEKRAAGFTQI